jgi:hypothetical protein
MRLRKLGRNWRYGIGELVIVVCGVLIALAVEGWRQSLQNRGDEREYVARLKQDLAQDTLQLARTMELSRERATYAASLLRVLDAGSLESPEELARAVEYPSWFNYPSYSRTTYEDLLSTGNLELLRDTEAKQIVASYYATIDWFEQFRDLFRASQIKLNQTVAALLDVEVRQALFQEKVASTCGPTLLCDALIPWGPTTLQVTVGNANAIRARLRDHPEAKSLYMEMARIHGMQYSNLASIRQLAIQALRTLDQYGEIRPRVRPNGP